MAIEATYTIGTLGGTIYEKVYDGKKLQANAVAYTGILDDDSFRWQITKDSLTHVGELELKCDEGFPQIYRNGVNVTSEYHLTQVQPAGTENLSSRPATSRLRARISPRNMTVPRLQHTVRQAARTSPTSLPG